MPDNDEQSPGASERSLDSRKASTPLTPVDIEEFRTLIKQECGVQMSTEEAWKRVSELLELYRMLLSPIPEDPEAEDASGPVRTSSDLHPIRKPS